MMIFYVFLAPLKASVEDTGAPGIVKPRLWRADPREIGEVFSNSGRSREPS